MNITETEVSEESLYAIIMSAQFTYKETDDERKFAKHSQNNADFVFFAL